MDRIAALKAFVNVVEAGSFSRAADLLDLPKTTVTRLVNDLEQDLEVRLLLRSSRSLRLTTEGTAYHARALRFLADLSELEVQTRQSIGQPSGRIRVEITAALATAVVVPAMLEFLQRYPDIQVELEVGSRSHSLVADSIDCALRLGEPDDQYLVARKIGEFCTMTCAAPSYLTRRGTPAQVTDLVQDHILVGLLSSATHRPLPFRFRGDDGQLEVAPTGEFTFSDANAYLAAGEAGLGLIQAPAYVVCAALDAGKLVPVLQDLKAPGAVPAYVVYPPNRFLSAKVRVFIDWLVELFGRESLKRGA